MTKTLDEKRKANRESQAKFWAKFTPEERLAKRKGYSKKGDGGSTIIQPLIVDETSSASVVALSEDTLSDEGYGEGLKYA